MGQEEMEDRRFSGVGSEKHLSTINTKALKHVFVERQSIEMMIY